MSVYFIRVGEYIKIGYSHDPVNRATTVTRSGIRPADIPFGADVDLIGWVPGDVWTERAFHVQHIEHRVAGEWFRLTREAAEELIWSDPRGIDLERMTAQAVFVSLKHPEITREEMYSGLEIAIHQFAKRQMTWFRRDQTIHWLDMTADPAAQACALIDGFLNGKNAGETTV